MDSLVLGTAQLGFKYGIANKIGQPAQAEADVIIREAWERGIRIFDTAQGYGESEHILGRALFKSGYSDKARVVSKIDPRIDHLNVAAVTGAINQSIEALKVPRLFGLLLHKEEMLALWDKGLSRILRSFVASGQTEKIGVSVYSPDMALKALNIEGIDIVQLPANMLDRRFENAGVFELAQKKQKHIYIRSIFLQGLLLMDIEDIPANMAFVVPVLEKLDSLSNDLGLTKREIAVGYVKEQFPNSHVIFGAETRNQVAENAIVWKKKIPRHLSFKVRQFFPDIDERILNPVLW